MSTPSPITQKSAKEEAGKKRALNDCVAQNASTLSDALSTMDLQRAVADPRAARPPEILALQRKYGNDAVQRLLADHNLQAKLTVGAANDSYEQEADRVAAQVMSAPVQTPDVQRQDEEEEIQTKPLAATITPMIQRQRIPEEEEEKPLQGKFIQRQAKEEEELQTKSIRDGEIFTPGADFESRLAATRGSGRPLPKTTRDFMEQRFGADFSGVRVHIGSESAQLNTEVSAQAFTRGQDIYLGEGKENVESSEGKQLLAHELTHTIQQGATPILGKSQPRHRAEGTTEIQRHSETALEDQIKAAKLEEEAIIQTKPDTVQRHSDAALKYKPMDSKLKEGTLQARAIDIQRHQRFPKHEPFRGPETAVPPGRRWRLNSIVPETEQRKYKQAIIAHVEKLFATDLSKRSKLCARIVGIKIVEDPDFHSPAQGQPGKIVINPGSPEFYTPQGDPDVEAVRSTLLHEMFHSSSINHEGQDPDRVMEDAGARGLTSESTTLIKQTEEGGTQETFDEAATEWFAMQVYKQVYPDATYKSSYFTKAPKTRPGGGEGLESVLNTGDKRPDVAETKDQVPLVMKELGITEEALIEMYLHDHAKLAALLQDKKGKLKDLWRGHEQTQLHEKYPLTTNAGIKELIADVIHEHEDELGECKTREEQLTRLKEILKQQHNVEVDLKERPITSMGRVLRTIPATPGVADALNALPAPGETWSTDDQTTTLNKGHIRQALVDLKIRSETIGPDKSLRFVLVTPRDEKATTLDKYPPERRFGVVPAIPFPMEGNPYDALKDYGGGGYEQAIYTAFLIVDHANSYHHYLHEIGHYKQHLQGYDETTVPNTVLLDFHNILINENTAKHIRTLYSTKDKMSALMTYQRQFADVKKDVEGHKVMRKMFAEIETEIAKLKPIYQELYKRNLTYEYFKRQGDKLKAWKTA